VENFFPHCGKIRPWKTFFHTVENFFPWRGKVEVRGEGVAVEDEDGVGGEEGFDEFQGAAGAEGFGLAGEDDVEAVGGARGEMGVEDVGLVAGGEEDAGDAVALEPVELPFEEGAAGGRARGPWAGRGSARRGACLCPRAG
jgi:hypothetical protein